MYALQILSTLLAVGGALAGPITSGLEITLSSSPSINSIDELAITATVTNTGSEDAKIIKYGTVLDNGLTKSFTVTKDGKTVDFTGIKVFVQPELVGDDAFAVIPAGKSVEVTHELGSVFDFESFGTGTYTFEPNTNFITATSSLGAVASHKVNVEIKSDVAKRGLAGDKRATVSCSTSSYKSFITSAYSEAKSLASIASSYVSTYGASDSLYKSYWGTTSTSTITGVFNKVSSESSSSRTLNCNDPYGACTSGVIAYTLISSTNIYFCSLFYNEVTTSNLCSGTSVASRNIRGGTVLHELTHATSGTDDVTYGCSADIALSDANSARNADSYNCFATQVYYNTQC